MKVKRLHVLIASIGMACLFFGVLNWMSDYRDEQGAAALNRDRLPRVMPGHAEMTVARQEVEAVERLRWDAAQSVAVVGEAYKPLRRQFGDIPPISRPLRAAKERQARGLSAEAQASARESWLALKAFRGKVSAATQSYQVVRGDTLWRIARSHSPARDGAGWVTIWKANKNLVTNFDRLEVGLTLTTPGHATPSEALSGKIVFTYSIANFPTLRCLEQIRNDVCYHKANVKVVSVGAGLAYGALGSSHQALEDIAVLRALPEMTVIAPGDGCPSGEA